MALDVDFDADVAATVSDLGGTVEWDGDTPAYSTSYACVISTVSKATKMEDIAGYMAEIAFQIVVQTSLLTVGRIVARRASAVPWSYWIQARTH